MNTEVEHLTFQLDEVIIHAGAAGPQEGPMVILLHGFPEFWYGWRGQIAPLASAGFRVVVPGEPALIREQAFGEALDADKLERLGRYEVHLDRKLEQMLAMLLRLKDLRQGAIKG